MQRRKFIMQTGTILAGATILSASAETILKPIKKKRIAMVGLGVRGMGMWGKPVIEKYGSDVEFVGLCDINEGSLAYVKSQMGVSCPSFTDFEKMMKETKPDTLIDDSR